MPDPKQYDVAVIGTGAAGSTVAHKCKDAGWSVAIVDNRPYGGTCALRGCDPKKVLVGAAEALDRLAALSGKGLSASGTEVNWPNLMRFKRTFTEPVPASVEKSFSNDGIETFHGVASFTGTNSMKVGESVLNSRFVVIASGSEPVPLGFDGETHFTTSEQFLELDRLPPRIGMIGGGYISFEFAFIAANAGAEVHIFHKDGTPLRGFDPDLVSVLLESTRHKGINLHLDAPVTGIEQVRDGLTVSTGEGATQGETVVDMVVHGAGRAHDFSAMDLAAGNVEGGSGGITVNKYLQSVSNPAVYSAGDAAASPGPPLTPVGTMEGHVVASNILKGNNRTPDYDAIPTVVFALPHLARVGMLEHEARDADLDFEVKHGDSAGWYTSKRIGEKFSGYKTLVEKDTDRILGAHLLGPNAEEVINVFAVAMKSGMKASELRRTVFAYPTASSDIPYMV